ncbi:hypothetical protein PYCCODRAFT_1418218 [Trametes coccinea BRFM310]|uniref:Uncharacterized protein n=1 Tax=Trametes coccinea (strain BRFM310) TaxID=1353009 RepID=A0A1Y2ICP2_TRAC3|nr:hypothetical protein PYCCODRAFT_1418218 [Trametes coccinea BRFM310]
MKTKPSRLKPSGKHPYESTGSHSYVDRSTHEPAQCTPWPPPTPAPPVTVPAPEPNPGHGTVLLRDLCLGQIHKLYPGFQPRSDFDILQLASTRQKGTYADIYAWLDKTYASFTSDDYGRETTDKYSTQMLNKWVDSSGHKPKTGDEFGVFTQPLPDSKYSIRLFPGSVYAAEYFLDFVETETGQPVNHPFEHELWGIPDPDTPHLSVPCSGKLRSVERAAGIKPEDIFPGEEKYMLRDGLTCLLTRPGTRPVRFTVPVRRKKVVDEGVEVLHFPRTIDLES